MRIVDAQSRVAGAGMAISQWIFTNFVGDLADLRRPQCPAGLDLVTKGVWGRWVGKHIYHVIKAECAAGDFFNVLLVKPLKNVSFLL